MSDSLVVTLILLAYSDLDYLMSDALVVTLILVVFPDFGFLMSYISVVDLNAGGMPSTLFSYVRYIGNVMVI